MTSALIRVTNGPRRVVSADLTTGGFPAPDAEVVEVLGYRSARLVLRALGFEGSTPSALVISMETGMDLKDPSGFVSVGIFPPIVGKGGSTQVVCANFQRFLRWRVMDVASASAVTFVIEGVVYE